MPLAYCLYLPEIVSRYTLLSIKLVSIIYLLPEEVVKIQLRFVTYKVHSKKQYSMLKAYYYFCFLMFVRWVPIWSVLHILIFEYFPFASFLFASQNVVLYKFSFLDIKDTKLIDCFIYYTHSKKVSLLII